MTKYIPGDIKIIKRVKKTKNNPFGVEPANKIPVSEPALMIFGGEGASSEKDANWYASRMEKLFQEEDISGVDIYSVFYKFESEDTSSLDRINLFRKAGRKIKLSEKEKDYIENVWNKKTTPIFIKNIFDIIIKPRISNDLGEKLDVATAMQNMRKITFYAHCHGCSVLMYAEKFMYDQMLSMGYKRNEILKIQKNTLVVSHAPIAPLGKSNFTILSFISAQDTAVEYYNLFNKYVSENYFDVYPSYFPDKQGNFFIAGKLKEGAKGEHSMLGLVKSETPKGYLTPDGEKIFNLERKILTNGLENSKTGKNLPSVRKLISGSGISFETLLKNANFFYKVMLNDLREQKRILKPEHQK